MKRRLLSLLLVLLTVLSASTAAFAADDTAASPAMELAWSRDGDQVTAELYLTAPGATNGRAVITYDPAVLTLESASAADQGWITSLDIGTAGKVAFAWVDSELSAASTRMLTLALKAAGSESSTTIQAEMTELYQNQAAMTLPESASQTIRLTDAPENPYTDIDDHWAKQEILAGYQMGIFDGGGMGGGKFQPDRALTRGMFAVLLYRMAGSPEAAAESPFADVSSTDYYSDAVAWAYESGVITGVTKTLFVPNEGITREQMVTMLYRYAKFAGMNTEESASLDGFTDAAQVSGYAVPAMQWAVARQIIRGMGNRTIQPSLVSTRAQAAVVLNRFAK